MVLRWAWLLTLYWTLCGGCKIRGILRTKYQTPLSLSRAITSPTARSSWKGRRCLLCSNLARNEVAEPAMEDRIRSDSMSRVIVKAQQVFYDALVTWSQWDSFRPQFYQLLYRLSQSTDTLAITRLRVVMKGRHLMYSPKEPGHPTPIERYKILEKHLL